MRRNTKELATLFLAGLVALGGCEAWSGSSVRDVEVDPARGPEEVPEPPETTPNAAVPRPSIPDVVLTDQFGEEHRFYTDLIKDKLVLMNAIYTSCAGTCPMQTSIFASVQRHLGDREVQMLSISLDPLNDRPAELKEFAEKYDAQPGWLFLTGPKKDVATALKAMDLYAPVPEEHTPICSVGNEATGVWMKLVNLSAPDEIVDRIDYVTKLDPAVLYGSLAAR